MTEVSEENINPSENKEDKVDQVGKSHKTRRRYFQMFDAHFLAKQPIHEIAKHFGVSKSTVYLAFQYVEKYTPEIGQSILRLGAIRDQQETIRMFQEERDAIREYLREKRNGKEFDKTHPKYNHYMLKAMDEQIMDNKKLLYKMTSVLENELEDAAKAMGMTITEAFPKIFAAMNAMRPKKHDEPKPEHRLKEGNVAGGLDTPPASTSEDQGGPGESAGADGGGPATDQ